MKKTSIGGQALIEGLMMIGPDNSAIAIRKPDGEILVEKKLLPKKFMLQKIPIIRGAIGLFRQMVLGVKALLYSAEFVEIEGDENEEPSKIDKFLDRVFGDKLKDIAIYFSVIISLVFSVGLFILLPNFLADFMHFDEETQLGRIYLNLFEGLIRVALFFTYLALVSQLKDMKRVWEYHGAEHKTIHCYENGEALTVENIKKYSTKHPRCGTSFFFTVMIISILVFAFAGWYHPVINALVRIALIPFVAGIALEIIKFTGRSEIKFFQLLNVPGMAFQFFTTREPDDSQIEVAIAAFKGVQVEDKTADNW
ncbi:MAG: DUF1385 domain-containing protein [Clostridia bacterium]|nr:DUF1385 domain-containing protein [Clostridia bacterium]